MTKVAIDVDNTLFDFEAAARGEFIKLALERSDKSLFRGAYHPWQEWRSMTDVCGSEACWEVIKRVHSPEVIAEQIPFVGATTVLRRLSKRHELLYISNRRPETIFATELWLQSHDFPPGELICNLDDKISQVSACQFIIDDRPKTLVHFVHDFTWRYSRGDTDHRLGFGIAFPYNQALTDIPRIYLAPTWRGLAYYMEDKGVL